MNCLLRNLEKIITHFFTDKMFVKYQYYKVFRKKLHLNCPITFNEKIQYLKIYDRNPLYTLLADKYRVKEYVASLIGDEYLIPTLGVWKDPSEIDFDKLPNRFVLKCNHDSGSVIICEDKNDFNFSEAKKRLSQKLKKNFFFYGREWSYKNIKPVVLAEKYMADGDNNEITDYKFYCFDGRVDCVMVCLDRKSGDTKFYFFDKQWNLKRINKRGIEAPRDFTIEKPKQMDCMFEIAEKLSSGIPFVRIDLYQCQNQIFFGEYTFYPHSGTDKNYLPETELYFGNLIDLDNVFSKRRKK